MPLNLAKFMLPVLIVAGAATSFAATTLDGVFTEDQATRGKTTYSNRCAGCHGDDFVTIDRAPLGGPKFLDNWREDTIDLIFDFIKNNMPRNAAATVAEKDKLDVLAYLLKSSGFPAGSRELTAAALPDILLVGLAGPKPLPNESNAVTTGCLTGDSDNWTLTKASQATRARDIDSTTPDELKRSDSKPLGSLTIKLSNVEDFKPGFKPDTLKGHKVQAKGLLHLERAGQRITVGSLESLSNSCGA